MKLGTELGQQAGSRRVSSGLWTGVVAIAITLGAFAPASARAGSYSVSSRPIVYQEMPLPDGEPVVSLSGGAMFGGDSLILEKTVTLPFPVSFYGTSHTTLNVGANGFVTFGSLYPATSAVSHAIPGSASPHQLVAVWWDQIVCDSLFSGITNGPVLTQVVGTAPNRRFVVQWTKCRKYASSGAWFEAQLWLFEGSNMIEAQYGNVVAGTGTSFIAAMGVENSDGTDGTAGLSATGLNCGATCLSADFPVQTALTYSSGPWLSIASVTGDSSAVPGAPMNMSAVVQNLGSEVALGFTARFWLSASPELTGDAVELGVVPGTSDTLPGGSVTFQLTPTLPAALAHGDYYVIAEVDPFGAVAAAAVLGVFGPFAVSEPIADLAVGAIVVPSRVDVGGDFTLQWTARNIGTLGAADVPYLIVLAPSLPIDGETGLELHAGSVDLDAHTDRPMSLAVSIPDDFAPGSYLIRIVMDPEETIEETRRGNNVRSSLVFAIGPVLTASTTVLPAAILDRAWSVELRADGGDGRYVWSVAAGSALPPGLALETQPEGGTLLEGVPTQLGAFSFALEVVSIGMKVRVDLALEVSAVLRIGTGTLPPGVVGADYTFDLVAIGGTSPLHWSIAGGELPAGLALAPTGRLSGVPMESGEFTITFQVDDDAGQTDSKALVLNTDVARDPLACVTASLPTVRRGEAIQPVTIAAAGGKEPYRWSIKKTERLPTDLDPGKVFRVGMPPPGLLLAANGSVTGTPQEIGLFDWTLQVDDALAGAATCVVRVEVSADHALEIVRLALEAAEAEATYQATLEATGGTDALAWSLATGSRLPDGLALHPSGVLSGTPTRAQLEGARDRTFTFDVHVMDSFNRVGGGLITLRVYDPGLDPEPAAPAKPKAKKSGGCQAAGDDLSLLALGMALGVVALRRRF